MALQMGSIKFSGNRKSQSKLFLKKEKEGKLPNSSCDCPPTLTPTQIKNCTRVSRSREKSHNTRKGEPKGFGSSHNRNKERSRSETTAAEVTNTSTAHLVRKSSVWTRTTTYSNAQSKWKNRAQVQKRNMEEIWKILRQKSLNKKEKGSEQSCMSRDQTDKMNSKVNLENTLREREKNRRQKSSREEYSEYSVTKAPFSPTSYFPSPLCQVARLTLLGRAS